MKLITKLVIGIVLIILIYSGIFFATHKTGQATATVEFNIVSNVTPTVTPTPAPEGGGGGGGITKCIELWQCDPWGECSPSEYQIRSCFDNNFCSTIKVKPTEIQRCNYITRPPNCFDKIKNNNEEGIDCGGRCVPCPSCNDGIKNQDEADVDCGGVCGECVLSVNSEGRAPGAFSMGILVKDINLYWPAWLLLSILLLILIQLYNEVKEQIKEQREYKHHASRHISR